MPQDSYDKSARIYDFLYVGIGLKDYKAETAELDRLIKESCPTARTLLDVACGRLPGIPLQLALTPTADYVSAMESAGFATRVIPNYMPERDRIVGVKAANP